MFKLGPNSIGFEVTKRVFGKQDRGISPKGANDQTSFTIALSLLGNPKTFQCYEIFFAHKISFSEDIIFCLTGAHYQEMLLNKEKINHAQVYKAKKGDILQLKKLNKGFRIYLTTAPLDKSRIGKKSKPYAHYFPQLTATIRVTKGPEFDYLQEEFFKYTYPISSKSDMSGLRLEKKLQAKKFDIITSAVTDGTIQLTKDGPIVLMRHRQSTGGYPRVLNVIESDMDTLAQYPHKTSVRFELVTMEESIELLLEYEKTIQTIAKDLR